LIRPWQGTGVPVEYFRGEKRIKGLLMGREIFPEVRLLDGSGRAEMGNWGR